MGNNERIDGLSEALAHIDREGASAPLVANMMVKCRKLLEGTATKKTYPIAKLFGNWALHTELTSDKTAIEILEDVNQFVVELLQGAGGGPFGQEITRRIKLADLRSELLAICRAFHIVERPIADAKSWAAIKHQLLGELCGSPIKATAKTQAALLKKYSGAHWLVTAFEIIKDRERLDKFPENPPFGFVVHVSEAINPTAAPRHIISQFVY